MIVKWEDEVGTSYLDYVIHVTKLNGDKLVRVSQATLDQKVVTRDFEHGNLFLVSDKGTLIGQYDLGPRPPQLVKENDDGE